MSDVSTLHNDKRNANGAFFQTLFQCANVAVVIVSALKSIMKEQLEEMEELRIPSIVLSTKDDMLLLIRGAKTYHLSHDVVTLHVSRDVSTSYS